MRTLPILILTSLAAAAVLTLGASREPFAPRLVRLEAAAAVPEMASVLENEPIAVNAVVLEYAHMSELRLNAHLALRRYPELSREILPLWSVEPAFREVLAEYGPAVMPPIAYFMHHEIHSLRFFRAAEDAFAGARQAAQHLFGAAASDDGAEAAVEPAPAAGGLTSVDRGWIAITFIREEGHDFLGQFVVDASGQIDWVQTERITEAAAEFFTSGIRALEVRYRRNEEPTASDYLWAGVDIAFAAGALKVARLGRISGTGAASSVSLATSTVLRGGRAALRGARYGVPVAVAYAVVRHPSLISGLAAQVANLLGWPVALVQAMTWFLVLLPLLLALNLLLRWLVGPTLSALSVLSRWAIR